MWASGYLGPGENFFPLAYHPVFTLDTVTGNLAVNSVFITIRSMKDTNKFYFFLFFETIPKKTQQTDLMFSHNPIFALFSSVAIQREQRKNQEQGNVYKDLSVRSCAESVRAHCACVKCSCDF